MSDSLNSALLRFDQVFVEMMSTIVKDQGSLQNKDLASFRTYIHQVLMMVVASGELGDAGVEFDEKTCDAIASEALSSIQNRCKQEARAIYESN